MMRLLMTLDETNVSKKNLHGKNKNRLDTCVRVPIKYHTDAWRTYIKYRKLDKRYRVVWYRSSRSF